MAKGFHTLIRLHQWRVDEKRRALGDLLGRAVELQARADNLESPIVGEQQAAQSDPVESGMYYGAFASAAVARRGEIADARSDLEAEISVAQDEMRVEYKELKTYEISQEGRDIAEEREFRRDEQAELDEIGLNQFRRKDE